MAGDPPNAVPVHPGPGWLQRSVPPLHELAWIRIGGAWHRALIRCWVREHHGWQCLIEADGAENSPWNGRYEYDLHAIRPRYGPQPPGD